MNKFFEELKKTTDDFPDEYKAILMLPPRERMRFGIMLANAQLDYILSGEWRNDQQTIEEITYGKRRSKK